MAHELRCIAFDRREIGEMVRSFAAWRLGRSPEGTVIDIQKVERDVLVTFEDARGDLDTVRLTETDGIACRLAYCRQRSASANGSKQPAMRWCWQCRAPPDR